MAILNSSIETIISSAKASESAYLGCLISNATTGEFPQLSINPEYFYHKPYRFLYEIIKEISDSGGLPDVVTIGQKIDSKEGGRKILSNTELMHIVNGDYHSYNIRRYEGAIAENYRKISSERLIQEIQKDTERSPATLMKMAQELIGLATSSATQYKGVTKDDIHKFADWMGELQGKRIYGYSWGNEFKFMDDITKGIQKGLTYRIGAPSNTGKSQFMYSVINSLMKQNVKVMFFTLENAINGTLSFIMSNYQRENLDKIKYGEKDGDYEYLCSLEEKLFIIEDTYDISDIFSKIMEAQPDVVVIDYIGLAGVRGFIEEAKYTEYSTRVQRFVKQQGVAWIDLSNLSTNLQRVEDIKLNPQFYGSTFLRNNTDVGIHIVPDPKFAEAKSKAFETRDQKGIEFFTKKSGVILYVSKNRHGDMNVSTKYLINFDKGGEWKEIDNEIQTKIDLYSI